MPLESLHTLVGTLRQRIQAHRPALSGSEWLTRYTLIDPLLRELGWDTEDPELVIPEYSSGGGRADYALLGNDGKSAMIVEAKKLGEPLSLSVISQVLNYCLIEGTAHFAMTDGRHWEIYETHKPVPIADKQVAAFDLLNTIPSDVCLKALALWRQNIATGAISIAHTPVVTPTDDAPPVVQPPEPSVAAPPTQPTPIPTPPSAVADANREWVPLSKLSARKGVGAPADMVFPDNSTAGIRAWSNIVVEVTRWLMDAGHLNESHCPVQHGSNYVLATQPVHPSGEHFKYTREVNSLYINTNYANSAKVRNARLIIEHVGQDPSQFKVRW